eukprot:1718451-Rhodomonas_salina.1
MFFIVLQYKQISSSRAPTPPAKLPTIFQDWSAAMLKRLGAVTWLWRLARWSVMHEYSPLVRRGVGSMAVPNRLPLSTDGRQGLQTISREWDGKVCGGGRVVVE